MYDLIEFITKTIELMFKNPIQFATIAVFCGAIFSFAYYRLNLAYKKKIADLSETVVGLYDVEAVSLELLKEADSNIGKSMIRKFAYAKSGKALKVYKSQAAKNL